MYQFIVDKTDSYVYCVMVYKWNMNDVVLYQFYWLVSVAIAIILT